MNPENTAISRRCESLPVRELYKAGMFDDHPILDYGCGKGADVMYLNGKGLSVYGYDPFHYPVKLDSEFKIIYCNYVLNVIDDFDSILSIVTDILVHLEMNGKVIFITRTEKEINAAAKKSGWPKYNNGYLTKKNTFQKGYTHAELVKIITQVSPLREIPCPVKSSAKFTIAMFE